MARLGPGTVGTTVAPGRFALWDRAILVTDEPPHRASSSRSRARGPHGARRPTRRRRPGHGRPIVDDRCRDDIIRALAHVGHRARHHGGDDAADGGPAPAEQADAPDGTDPDAPAPANDTPSPPATAGGAANSVDRVAYSMNGPHEGSPHGVPSSFDWGHVPVVVNAVAPAGMGSITGFGQIYADSTNAHPANVRVELRDMATYVWSRSQGKWQRIQVSDGVGGAHYVEDFAGNSSTETHLRTEPDGGVSTDMVPGYNFHFWPQGERATLSNPGDIGAVYTTVMARLIVADPSGPDNRGAARYLANVGGDWWRSKGATFGDGSNNPGVGQGRMSYIGTDWTAIDFYTGGPLTTSPNAWSEAQLRSSNPPV